MTETAHSDEDGRTSAAPLDVVIADLAREVVGQVAPEQSKYLELVIVARDRGVGRVRRPASWSGGKFR